MRKTTLTLVAGAVAIAASGAAFAQGSLAPAEDLSRATVEQRAAEAFGRMDANNDGKLDAADRESRRQARFERLDANNDGNLDAADREARRKAMFERADANGDGSISYDEFAALGDQQGVRPEGARSGRFGMRGDRMGRRGMRGMGLHADADNDGAISRAEFTSAILARFDAADADGNGVVTAAERKAQRDAWRERRFERAS